jgi:hypothetical protein
MPCHGDSNERARAEFPFRVQVEGKYSELGVTKNEPLEFGFNLAIYVYALKAEVPKLGERL